MNPTQVGNLIKSALLALGVSGTVLGYVSAEAWVAVGGAVVAVGTVIWQVVAGKTNKLIEAVAAEPVVGTIVVHDPAVAAAIPSPKVISPLT